MPNTNPPNPTRLTNLPDNTPAWPSPPPNHHPLTPGLGYLLGPAVGNGLFSLTHPKLARGNPPPIDVMDREFYHRIKTRRADPSHQNVTNVVPDYFGEKVSGR